MREERPFGPQFVSSALEKLAHRRVESGARRMTPQVAELARVPRMPVEERADGPRPGIGGRLQKLVGYQTLDIRERFPATCRDFTADEWDAAMPREVLAHIGHH